MENTKVTVDYNYMHDTFKDLQCGDYFTTKNEYGTYLFLYIDDNCIINIEEGGKVDRSYFLHYESIKRLNKVKIIVEE